MSAEHLLNDDLPDDTKPSKVPVDNKPSYYDLMTLRLEAGARLARALKTLTDANVLPASGAGSTLLATALEVAERHFADICMGLVPVRDGTDVCTIKMREDLPACVEAFRIVVMEHAQREALERECRNMIADGNGFKILTQPQVLHIGNKHVCDENCDHRKDDYQWKC